MAGTPPLSAEGQMSMAAPISTSQTLTEQFAQLRKKIGRFLLLPDLVGEAGQDLRAQVHADGEATPGYMLMCGLSAGIAILGLLQSSVAVVIGAMLVSPLMSPIVALGFGFSSIDGKQIREAAKVVAIGAGIGIVTAILLTWLSPIRNPTSEIIARTAPTLLDLGVALLSGVAGGYAIVKRMGATAIGVAIATALMPPLATVGYGIGTLQWSYAAGALLLFLTNLAAIAFAIAIVSRLSGAARPLNKVEMTPGLIIAGLAAFLALATPLALTLIQVTHEATARSATRVVLTQELNLASGNIAQLDVAWPFRGEPKIDAVVIAPNFRGDAQAVVLAALTKRLGTAPTLNLQQVVAADVTSQTRAIVNAAMERTAAGISKDVPPFSEIRAMLGIPVQSLWINRAERIVNIVPITAPGWILSDYRETEAVVTANAGGWQVRIIPPVESKLTIALAPEAIEADTSLAIWAVQRWGLRSVGLDLSTKGPSTDQAQAQLDDLVARFKAANIVADGKIRQNGATSAEVVIFGPSPSQRRAQLSDEAQEIAKQTPQNSPSEPERKTQ